MSLVLKLHIKQQMVVSVTCDHLGGRLVPTSSPCLHQDLCGGLKGDLMLIRYALGDLLEMSGYGLTQRSVSNVRISGLCADPYKVRRTLNSLTKHNRMSLRSRGFLVCQN